MNSTLTRVATHAIAALIVAAPIVLQPAAADDKPLSSSQSKMAACSAQNKGKKGDEFKKAQSDCLKGETTAAATPMSPQDRMKMCSAQNKGKKGDDYKKAQSDCLKG